MRLTHIGGPTVLVELDGWRILTDPTFDQPGHRYRCGWGTSSTETDGPALSVELGHIDAILRTHDHHADERRRRVTSSRALPASGAGRYNHVITRLRPGVSQAVTPASCG